MFEDCRVESSATPISSGKRWTALISISLQFAFAAAIATLPLLHPEALQFHVDPPRVLLPPPPKPPIPIAHVEKLPASSSSSISIPSPSRPLQPSLLPDRNMAVTDYPPPVAPVGTGMSAAEGIANSLLASIGDGHGPAVSIAQPKPSSRTLHVSAGVSTGMLLSPIRPIYPAIAKAAHVEGAVVVEALISKTGAIESLHVISGPAMLQGAAIEAIRAARYQPFRLNGEPTEVQTTITVNFQIRS